MSQQTKPEDLMEFPCRYVFKAIGQGGNDFYREIVEAIRLHVPVPAGAVRRKSSREGTYQSISVLLTIDNAAQLTNIYVEMKKVSGLKMLL